MHVTVDIVEAWEAGWGVEEVSTTEERGWQAENRNHMSYSLNSLKWDYIGDYYSGY